MPGRHSRFTLAMALSISLAVHAWLLVFMPLPQRSAAGGVREQTVAVYLEPPPPPAPPPPEQDKIEEAPKPPPEPEIALGLNAPLPRSLTWLGFTQFSPQFAPPAEIEQAAFTDEPVSAAPRESQSPTPPTPTPTPPAEAANAQAMAQPAPPVDAPAPVETHEPAPAVDSPLPAPTPERPEPEPSPVIDEPEPPHAESTDTAPVPLPLTDEGRDSIPASLALVKLIDRLAKDVQAMAERSLPAPPSDENPAVAKPPTPAAAAQPQPAVAANKPIAPQPTEGATDQGIQSDKQSQPTSVIEVPPDQWQLGKPLAGKGLELKPRRPVFTLLTMLTAAPGNPLCEMHFNRAGEVVSAKILKSSGDTRIDEAILNSLYYWRAAGEELDKLAEGETLPLQMRLMLTRRSG